MTRRLFFVKNAHVSRIIERFSSSVVLIISTTWNVHDFPNMTTSSVSAAKRLCTFTSSAHEISFLRVAPKAQSFAFASGVFFIS